MSHEDLHGWVAPPSHPSMGIDGWDQQIMLWLFDMLWMVDMVVDCQTYHMVGWHVVDQHINYERGFTDLDDGKIWTGNPWKALYLMVKTMVSGYDFPLNQSIDWNIFYIWLVVWNMIFFPYIGNLIIPTDELIFFRGVGLNHQPVFPLYHSFEIFPQFFQDFSKFSQIFPQFFPRFCPKLVVVWVFPGDWDFCARNSHLKIQETPNIYWENRWFPVKVFP